MLDIPYHSWIWISFGTAVAITVLLILTYELQWRYGVQIKERLGKLKFEIRRRLKQGLTYVRDRAKGIRR